ncbi:MAG: hypothetical protein ACI9AP_001363, partial [Flavobacteriales bacterium]
KGRSSLCSLHGCNAVKDTLISYGNDRLAYLA